MKKLLILIPVAIAIAFSRTIASESRQAVPMAIRATSNDARVADAAIEALRRKGQRGVDLMVASEPASPEKRARYRAALDRVCRQRDCYASRLYWYTNIERAKSVAKATRKPILALHLLGNLDEDLSCANSRFFRTTLYSNPQIAEFMREHFVLYWQSVRPVPKVTVEFGDGRRLLQTITGNSIHYVLDADGNPLEALPGLYSPDAFLSQLRDFDKLARRYSAKAPADRAAFLQEYHQAAWRKTADVLGADLWRIRTNGQRVPTAREAARMSRGKTSEERPILLLINPTGQPITDPEWKRVTAQHIAPVAFHSASLELIREKSASPDTFNQMLANLERSVAEDTARNELDLHLQIHNWFVERVPSSLASLNERVYAQLFLTPSSDPWLGLLQPDQFTGIENAGVSR